MLSKRLSNSTATIAPYQSCWVIAFMGSLHFHELGHARVLGELVYVRWQHQE
jgi:hypothetical protein